MKKVSVGLRPIVSNLNLPTVIKTTILPGDTIESLLIATQVGEIFYVRNGVVGTFVDIRSQIIELGASSGGYDERGLLGLAFHPNFYFNGLFYLHYSVAGSQGPGALREAFHPNPCDEATLNLEWANRELQYDHIDTVEEWSVQANGQPQRRRTLLSLRRPFLNHNGVNSLIFSPETGNLVLTTGDGGSGYDPFNLSQNDMEIAGKIIEINVNKDPMIYNLPAVTRFDELPSPVQETLTIMAKGVRNIPGISYQRYYNQYIKYVGNVGQDLVEAIYAFTDYKPYPVTQLVESQDNNSEFNSGELINFGWRGWEGILPTTIIRDCSDVENNEKIIAYYDDALKASVQRLQPLTCYYHQDTRPDKFGGSALTGVQAYMGRQIPDLTGSVIFTDFVLEEDEDKPQGRGVLAYTNIDSGCQLRDYGILEVDYDFGSQSSFYTSLGTNQDHTQLYLGVYGSSNVSDYNRGTVFEIVP
ncbi:MAG: glucose dehydrogenase [Herbinix sp.]|nr:glucose dehydrogenase [Herbinix sp.]